MARRVKGPGSTPADVRFTRSVEIEMGVLTMKTFAPVTVKRRWFKQFRFLNWMVFIRSAELAADEILTRRELQVARLAEMGFNNKEIAAQLGVSIETIRNHLNTVYMKLGIEGRKQLPMALFGLKSDQEPEE